MDFAIAIQGAEGAMTFEKATDYANNLFLSLSIPRGAFFVAPSFGSRLYLLPREKNIASVEAKVPGYVKEALQWMLDAGRLKSVSTVTERIGNRLNYRVDAVDARGRKLEFKNFVDIR